MRFPSLLAALGAIVLSSWATAQTDSPLSIRVENDFTLPSIDYVAPDCSAYTVEAVREAMPAEGNARVEIIAAEGERFLEEALRPRGGASDVRVISVEEGVITLGGLATLLADSEAVNVGAAAATVRMPILIRPGATLIIDGHQTPVVRLSTDHGVFIANAGTLYTVDAAVTGWDESKGEPSRFVSEERFRPFLASLVRSRTHLAGSRLSHLGYAAPTAYGVSLSTQPERAHGEPTEDSPTGVIVGNTFEDLYYGFYSYEARDVAIVDNTYTESIVYGIDPHDRSTRLTIVGNTTKGTKERHGIIGSRGVSHSYIVDNTTHDNAGSGVMLDRDCHHNVIAGNRVYNNGQGIAVYESNENLLLDNLVVGSAKSGLRVRNSTSVRVHQNTLVRNRDYALEISARRLSDHAKRMERGDRYETRVGVLLDGNRVGGNSGLIEAKGLGEVRLTGTSRSADLAELSERLGVPLSPPLEDPNDRKFGGDLKRVRDRLDRVFEANKQLLVIEGPGPTTE